MLGEKKTKCNGIIISPIQTYHIISDIIDINVITSVLMIQSQFKIHHTHKI